MKKIYFIGFLLCACTCCFAQVQPIPVVDKKHNVWSKILEDVQTASLLINTRVSLVVQKIEQVQSFVTSVHTLVNSTVRNVQQVNQTIEIIGQINNLVQSSIEAINTPRDHDLDGLDDLYYLNKWKHIQILLAIAGQVDSIWELFVHNLQDDSLVLDDKGRLQIIQRAYQDALKIRTAIRVQIRRIQKEIYAYQAKRRELLAFEALFGTLQYIHHNIYHEKISFSIFFPFWNAAFFQGATGLARCGCPFQHHRGHCQNSSHRFQFYP